jgi:dTDP-4-dehydrorhamnose reductase
MAVILVTGADGQLGSELKNVSKSFYGYDFIFTDLNELNITDAVQTAEFIKKTAPDWVINCAAYNSVDRAETEEEKAMMVNSTAVRNIAEALAGTECRFIHVSTDYVFSGNACSPYDENAIPDPLTTYGKSKLSGERAALLHNRSMIIRTSWLYSSHGTNFLKTILSKAGENDSLNVVFDQVGTPTWAADLAGAVMSIVSPVIRNQIAFNPGIYHYSNEGVCSWYDFATAIVEEAGLSCRIMPIRSSEFKSAARRPSYSVLDKSKIKENYNIQIPHWKVSMKKCIKQIIT